MSENLLQKLDELLAEAQKIRRYVETSILAEEFKDAGVTPSAETRRPMATQSEPRQKKPTTEAITVLTFNSDGTTKVETFALVAESATLKSEAEKQRIIHQRMKEILQQQVANQ